MAVQFLFDFGSPNAFLSHRVIPQIEARTGVRFEYVPVLLGGLFKLTGNQSPAAAFGHIKNKLAYEGLETRRFVARHGIADFRPNPHFPVNTLQIMRGAVAAQQLGVFEAYVDRVYDDMWVRGLKMDDPAVVRDALVAGGLPADEIARLSQTDEVKGRLLANTQYAFEKGAFGSPSFLVGDELYFGKDRLPDVETEIVRQAAGLATPA
ncbi:MAG TPA: 2-hydroxychromene-2-carboxylate isomerase [Phenylobacterium sp.]|nr:2-hydroxychromene-2-carboxylate isomerase [Phenylobacterium sp.]